MPRTYARADARQKINEPAMVMQHGGRRWRRRGDSAEKLDQITTANAMGFYRWG